MKEVIFPERLMGWVRAGAKSYELRFKYQHSLLDTGFLGCGNYVLYSIHEVKLPISVLFDNDRCLPIKSYQGRTLWIKEDVAWFKGTHVLVGENYYDRYWYPWNMGLRLKEIPANIR